MELWSHEIAGQGLHQWAIIRSEKAFLRKYILKTEKNVFHIVLFYIFSVLAFNI